MGVEERGGHASNMAGLFASYRPAVDVGSSVYDTGLCYINVGLKL